MFIYIQGEYNDTDLWVFKATGNAVHSVAALYQKGLIASENMVCNQFSKTITIKVLNSRGFVFEEGVSYYLDLEGCIAKGYLDIHMTTDLGRYVPSWYSYYIEDINPETWQELFHSLTPPEYVDPYIYYGRKAHDDKLDETHEMIDGIVVKKKEFFPEDEPCYDQEDTDELQESYEESIE